MKESNPFWQPIQDALWWAKAKGVFSLLVVGAVLPVVECVFVNLWTASGAATSSPFLVVLLTVVALHCILVLMAIIEGVQNRSDSILPRAFQLEEDSEKLARELMRRETTGKLVRSAFERLNLQTCEIEYSPASDAWCLQGFGKGLSPIILPFREQADLTLGVRGNRYTLEVYFKRGTVPIQGCKNDCHRNLSQLAFYSPHVDNCIAVRMATNRSPAQLGFDAGMPLDQHIENNKQLFYEAGKPVDAIYFRRYATCPINENCGDLAEGVLVLTSMQEEAFAADVSETLAFLATIISSYLSAYRRCYEMHNQPAIRRLQTAKQQSPPLRGPHPKRIEDTTSQRQPDEPTA